MTVTLTSAGDVNWINGDGLTTACEPDMTKFPFDQQTCVVRIMSWRYDENEIKFKIMKRDANLRRYTDNGEWTLISAVVEEVADGAEVTFSITIKRKPLYFILSVILPIIGLGALNPIVFCLPIETGERVSFSITLSLSFAVFLSITSDIIPKTSEPMALLMYFLFGAQTFSSVIAVINGFIIIVYSQPVEKEIPKIIGILVRTLGKITCNCNRNTKKVDPVVTAVERNSHTPINKLGEVERNSHTPVNKLNELRLAGVDAIPDLDPIDDDHNKNIELPLYVTWFQVGATLDSICYVVANLVYTVGVIVFFLIIV